MKNNIKIKLVFISLILSVLACKESPKGQDLKVDKKFYDLKNFFESESKRLTEGGVRIEKTIKVNGKMETKILEKPNFQEELAVFLACDVNRPAWRDKYKETILSHHTNKEAIDENLKIKSINIGREHYSIRVEDKSLLTEYKQSLEYQVNGGWNIKNEQKFLSSTAETIEISVRFLH